MKIGLPKTVGSANLLLQRHLPSYYEWKQKRALLLETKLNRIRVYCHEFTINEKEVSSLKTSNPKIKALNRPEYWRPTATTSINWQSNSIARRNVRLLNIKLS